MIYQLGGLLPGDTGIAQTLNRMVGAVKWSVNTYDIRRRAERIIASCPERDEQCEVRKIFAWVLKHYRYVKDPRFLEMFKSPETVDTEISMFGEFQGDCDDVSGYLAALLVSVGYSVKFVVIAIPNQGDDYRHVYPMVHLRRSGKWLALEATARMFPAGWEAPQGSRRREFAI